jgi:hypothetical protein
MLGVLCWVSREFAFYIVPKIAFLISWLGSTNSRLKHSFPTGLRIKETKEVYEGEVTELTPAEAENPLSGYGKTVSHVIVGLKTVKGTKQLRLDPTIYEAILKEKIVVGDVIYVEANTGAVKVRLYCFIKHIQVNFFSYREWDDLMRMPRPTTSNPRHTYHYQKATFINAKSLSKTLLSVISMPPMRVHKAAKTS